MQTLTVQIGNSDNKLSQQEWAHFVAAVRKIIGDWSCRIHFQGGSDWDAPWQNACWVCEVDHTGKDELIKRLSNCRKTFRQESIALTWGDTDLLH